MNQLPEDLRNAMRQWTTGVSIICCRHMDKIHGMTVNSFTSVSLEPSIITVTLANKTRTHQMVQESGMFSVSILNSAQEDLADRFSGKIPEEVNRFQQVKTIELPGGMVAIQESLAWLECKVRTQFSLGNSTLFLAEVLFARVNDYGRPLVYHNRGYYSL